MTKDNAQQTLMDVGVETRGYPPQDAKRAKANELSDGMPATDNRAPQNRAAAPPETEGLAAEVRDLYGAVALALDALAAVAFRILRGILTDPAALAAHADEWEREADEFRARALRLELRTVARDADAPRSGPLYEPGPVYRFAHGAKRAAFTAEGALREAATGARVKARENLLGTAVLAARALDVAGDALGENRREYVEQWAGSNTQRGASRAGELAPATPRPPMPDCAMVDMPRQPKAPPVARCTCGHTPSEHSRRVGRPCVKPGCMCAFFNGAAS